MRSAKCLVICFFVLTVYSCNDQRNPDKKSSVDSTATTLPGSADTVDKSSVETGTDTAQIPWTTNQLSLTGIHDLTLHWISWDRPGKIDISPAENGWHLVKGNQRDGKGNFLTIEGEIKAVSPLELIFRGTILTRVDIINNGDTCARQGEQVFLSTKKRKYWRLQAMENCEGNRVVDYIDIYF